MQTNGFTKDRLRLAHQQMALQMEPELFLTLATNQQMSLEHMKRDTRRFLRNMDRELLGRNFSKRSPSCRLDGLFYVERERSNIHVHALVTRPYCNRIGLQFHAERIWAEICPSGSVDIRDVGDVCKRSRYATKEAYKQGFFERQFFTARELMAAA